MNTIRISRIVSALFAVILCCGSVGLADPPGTAFTYQGRLIDADQPADGLYDLQFKLYDAASAGGQAGSDVSKPDVQVTDGYFTVELDFGSQFDGNARWLEIGVRPGVLSDPSPYRLLAPRQKITPTPYALYAASCTGISVPLVLSGSLTSPSAIISGTNFDNGIGVFGQSTSGPGVYGLNSGGGNVGLLGDLNYGVYGYSPSSRGVYGQSLSNSGVYGQSASDYGVYGTQINSGNYGYLGSSSYGVFGKHNSSGNYGFLASSNYGVHGYSSSGDGVYGYCGSSGNHGYLGGIAYGVYGYSSGGHAGYFQGNVYVSGNVGIGTTSPERKLHIAGSGPRILIEGDASNPEVNFKLTGDPVSDVWAIYKHSVTEDLRFYQAGDRVVIQYNSGNVGIGTSTPAGRLDVNGSIYQRGGVLHADYVFEPGYKLESIDEHAESMWQDKHLPAMPKMQKDENGQEIVEIGSHSRGIVEELEKAHIYIEQLNKENKELRAMLTTLNARLSTLESLMPKASLREEGGRK